MKYFPFLLILFFLLGCGINSSKVFDEIEDIVESEPDSIAKYIDAPFYVNQDTSDFIIYPVSMTSSYNRKSSRSYSYDYSKDSYYGYMYANFIFYNLSTKDYFLVSDNNINATSIYTNYATKLGLIFYIVKLEDTNKDNIIDIQDNSQLAVSKDDGTDFKVLTDTKQNLISWDVFQKNKYVVVRLLQDSDNDNFFDIGFDKMHIQQINLSNFENSDVFDKDFIKKAIK